MARFFEVLGNASLVFGNSSLHAVQNNRAAKMIKQDWVAPLAACVASLRAVLFFNLSTFWSFRDTMFLYSIFTKIEVCGFPKISNATETLPVSSVWVTPGRTIWQLSFWNKYHWLHVQRHLLSYQICSTITSQIIPRDLIAGLAECAQRWNPPPLNGSAWRARLHQGTQALFIMD